MLIDEKLTLNKQSQVYLDNEKSLKIFEMIISSNTEETSDNINKMVDSVNLWIHKYDWTSFTMYMWRTQFYNHHFDDALIKNEYISIDEDKMRKIVDKYGEKTNEDVYVSQAFKIFGYKDALFFLSWEHNHVYQMWLVKNK